ncbi:hypothetical protein YIM730264_12090 [Thermus hydrothermalis]
MDWTPGEDGKHQVLVAALPKGGRALGVAFALHPLSPFPSQSRVEEAFLLRLGRQVQALGYVPLFLPDRGFDRVSRIGRRNEHGFPPGATGPPGGGDGEGGTLPLGT